MDKIYFHVYAPNMCHILKTVTVGKKKKNNAIVSILNQLAPQLGNKTEK